MRREPQNLTSKDYGNSMKVFAGGTTDYVGKTPDIKKKAMAYKEGSTSFIALLLLRDTISPHDQ